MDLFAQNDEVARLEAALVSQKGEERLACLLSLAWYLRQSDCARALSLIQEHRALSQEIALSPRQVRQIQARIALIEAEVKWLHTDLDAASQLAEGALRDFTDLSDFAGVSDSHWLLGMIAVDRGTIELGQQQRAAAVQAARKIGDQTRADVADAVSAFSDVLINVHAAWEKWQARFAPELAGMDPVAVVWVFDFFAIAAALKSEFGRAAVYWMHSQFQTALQVFQQFQHCSELLNQSDFECLARRAQAHALLQLAQPEAALAAGLVAYEVAERAHNLVFEALNRHVHSLLEADTFMIFLLDPDGTALDRVFSSEQGRSLPARKIAFSNMSADSIRCLHERREIERNFESDSNLENLIPGSLVTLSALFAPLIIGDRVLGVMSVQSLRRAAFGERERLVFRTLCAYGAIALDNANAYQQLQQAQHHMMVQEKLAALGGLVAGVAHELNTPIGNCLMIATAWQERTSAMRQRLQSPGLQRSELLGFIDDAEESSAVMMRGLTSAADLVSSFKQVAVDCTTAQRRTFDLAQTTHEIIATMINQIKIAGHSISQDIPAGISLTSFPGPYGQVITNFINNALLHAFDGRSGGHMQVSARQTVLDRVSIQFSDDGMGISEQNQRRIFEPFFTTKMGQGGSGLGLSISYTIVTSLLNGQVYCESEHSRGTTFTLDLPLLAEILAEQPVP